MSLHGVNLWICRFFDKTNLWICRENRKKNCGFVGARPLRGPAVSPQKGHRQMLFFRGHRCRHDVREEGAKWRI